MSANTLSPQLSTFRSWVVVLTASLFFFYIFIQMNLFNSINSELVKEFGFTADQLSLFMAFYSYGNVIFLFPAGALLDRFSVRRILFIVFAISVIATYIFSTASNFWVMNFARLAVGLAGAFTFLSAVKLASRWFEPRHMAVIIGVSISMAMVGGVVAQTPLALLTQKFGWRQAMQLVAALGAILAIVQYLIVRDEPEGLTNVEIQEHVQLEKIGFWQSLKITLMNKQNWFSGLYICLVNLPLFVYGGMWGVPYLTQVHNFDVIQASTITTMLFIGMAIGSPLAGFISDSCGLRKIPMIVGAIFSILVMLVIMFAPTLSFAMEICLYLVFGIVLSSQVIGYPLITESNPHSITATASSLGSILVMSGGMLVPIFGWLLEKAGGAQIVDNIKIYSATDYIQANYFLLIGLGISLMVSLLVKETYCKQLNNN